MFQAMTQPSPNTPENGQTAAPGNDTPDIAQAMLQADALANAQADLAALQAKNAGLLGFNDGKWQGQLAAFGLAERAWAQSVYGGDFFHSAYRSHYADTELTVIAREQGRYVYEPNSVLVEADWDKESAAVNPADRAMYKARAATGFDARVHNPQLLQLFG